MVCGHLHHRRHDLLTPFLGRWAFGGRFNTGRTRFVLPLQSGFTRWTLSQQQTFTETLTRLSQDEGRNLPGIWQATARLAALPTSLPSAPAFAVGTVAGLQLHAPVTYLLCRLLGTLLQALSSPYAQETGVAAQAIFASYSGGTPPQSGRRSTLPAVRPVCPAWRRTGPFRGSPPGPGRGLPRSSRQF